VGVGAVWARSAGRQSAYLPRGEDGCTGKSSGGATGSITIRRGLDKVRPAARVIAALGAEGRFDISG
jgi:hypothetical protein